MDAEIASLKELIMEKFDGVHHRFNGTDDRLDALTEQVTQTNGRLRTAEASIAESRPRIQTLEREMGDVRRVVQGMGDEVKAGLLWVREQIGTMATTIAREARSVTKVVTREVGENRRISLWDVSVFTAGILATVAALKFFKVI